MNAETKRLLEYPTRHWMAGSDKINSCSQDIERISRLLGLLSKAERRAHHHVVSAVEFEIRELKAWHTQRADISKRAAIRIRAYINNQISELSI